MKLTSILLSQLLLSLFFISCKSNTAQPAPALGNSAVGISQTNNSNELNEIIQKNRSDLERIRTDLATGQTQSTGLQKKIDDLTTQINANKQLSEEQRKVLEAEIAAFKKQKEEADAKLKELADKQAAMEKQIDAASKGTAAASGFPFCGTIYYGDAFNCNGKQCGKSDVNFQNICEITATSKPASTAAQSTIGSSGNPLCGAIYYGELFTCNGKQCGKSDPGFQNMCEVTANSKPATAAAQTLGVSGYPFCGATRYGAVFTCNGRQCAKSDPEFKNICEIR